MKRLLSVLAALVFGSALICNAADREHTLKIYNWADYIDEALLDEFKVWYKEQTGEEVEIIYQLFDVNEIMLSKIEKGHEDFDVVCPSDYIIERMLRQDLLLPISRDFGTTEDYTKGVAPFMREKIGEIESSGKNAEDYVVAYMWGTTGILYNPKYVTHREASSWECLKDPKFKGKIFIKDAFRDVYTSLNIALHKDQIASGEVSLQSVCSDSSDESIAKVEEFLNEIKGNVLGWEADFGKEAMTKEKGWINLSWSGDAQWAIEEAEKVGVTLAYAVPEEGSTVWFDGWVIPKYAKNVQAARYFINFLCKPENAIRNMDVIGYVSALGGDEILEAMVDEDEYKPEDASYFFGEAGKSVCLNPIMYPDASTMAHCGMMHDSGDRTEDLLKMWSRVKGDNASYFTYICIGVALVAVIAVLLVNGRKKKGKKHRVK